MSTLKSWTRSGKRGENMETDNEILNQINVTYNELERLFIQLTKIGIAHHFDYTHEIHQVRHFLRSIFLLLKKDITTEKSVEDEIEDVDKKVESMYRLVWGGLNKYDKHALSGMKRMEVELEKCVEQEMKEEIIDRYLLEQMVQLNKSFKKFKEHMQAKKKIKEEYKIVYHQAVSIMKDISKKLHLLLKEITIDRKIHSKLIEKIAEIDSLLVTVDDNENVAPRKGLWKRLVGAINNIKKMD